MSRFSSIDGQHSALRDLERQRLEKLMGQLRREVGHSEIEKSLEASGGQWIATKVEPKADKAGRRFQPPGRRKERPKPALLLDPGPGDGPAGPGSRPESVAAPKEPKPPPATVPSAEMAWLLRVSERFDEEAREASWPEVLRRNCQRLLADGPRCMLFWSKTAWISMSVPRVKKFRTSMRGPGCFGIFQAPLLANGPGAPGASLEADSRERTFPGAPQRRRRCVPPPRSSSKRRRLREARDWVTGTRRAEGEENGGEPGERETGRQA